MAPAPRREDTTGHRARGRARATWSDVPVASTEVRERGQAPCSLFVDRTHESQTRRTAVVRTELSHVGHSGNIPDPQTRQLQPLVWGAPMRSVGFSQRKPMAELRQDPRASDYPQIPPGMSAPHLPLIF